MKIKTLVAVLLLSGGVTSTFAQTENCNSNSSISHEAVRAGNFKDAYAPCMAVLRIVLHCGITHLQMLRRF